MLRVNFYARITRAYFAHKSAILHTFYARVGAAIPVASTVYHLSRILPILGFVTDAKLNYDTTKV